MDYNLVYARIDLGAVEDNILSLRQLTGKNVRFMAVVKADAYGHGAVRVAEKAIEAGVAWLGVARFHEAEELRKAGINAPILIFGRTSPVLTEKIAGFDLTPTVYSVEMAEEFSCQAVKKGVKINAHLKIDTGMGRVGLLPDSRRAEAVFSGKSGRIQTTESSSVSGVIDAGLNMGVTKIPCISNEKSVSEIKAMLALPAFELQGIYTHFASADSYDKSYARYQLDIFNSLLNDLKKEKIVFEICHAANSAAIIDFPESHFDMVRAGIAMYGLYPSDEINREKVNLKPAMELRSEVSFVKTVPKGFKVSYGMTYETVQRTVIASVPIGYADGFSRLLSSKGVMLVKGIRAPVVGRVCMDQTLIDVGHIPDVKIGDKVVIIGVQDKESISADEIAGLIGTINYEIVSSLTARVPKLFFQ